MFCYLTRVVCRSILVFAVVVHVLISPAPAQASDSTRSALSRTEQTGGAVNPGDTSGAMAFLSDVKQTIWEIPEPATLLLLGSGLAAASRFMQRRRRSL